MRVEHCRATQANDAAPRRPINVTMSWRADLWHTPLFMQQVGQRLWHGSQKAHALQPQPVKMALRGRTYTRATCYNREREAAKLQQQGEVNERGTHPARLTNPHNFDAGHGPKAGSPPRSFSEVLPLYWQRLSFSQGQDPTCIGTCRLTTLCHLRGWPGPHNVPVEATIIAKALASAAAHEKQLEANFHQGVCDGTNS